MKIKKIALFAALLMITASIAYAVTGVAPSTAWKSQDTDGTITFPADTTNGPLLSFKPSANVHMAYDSTGQVYSLGSYHESGVKIYASTSGDSKIYMFDLATPPGSTAPTTLIPAKADVTAAGASWGAGWSALK
jgi:hypothetical protein